MVTGMGKSGHIGSKIAATLASKAMGAKGGVITIDGDGRVAMPFNTRGMYRGSVDTTGRRTVAVYADESDAAK